MRDYLILGLVTAGSLGALRHPWIGVMVWTWLSIMNPHRMTWGFIYTAPLAAVAACSVIAGMMITRRVSWPFKGAPTVLLAVLFGWITLSWQFGLDPAGDYAQWNKVAKIYAMVFVSLAVLQSKQHIIAFAWAAAGSLALLGIKGGFFTLITGGHYRVWGPPRSFIADNNEFALALVMTIPILRFLQQQLHAQWQRYAMTVAMLLCAAAVLGTHSRGALLAMSAMVAVLWWRGGSRVWGGLLMLIVGVLLVQFMPDSWSERMSTISEYQEDASALGRISAWWNALGIARDYPFGVGFNAARPELFAAYSPYPERVHAAHSIYFQVLGNHGIVGLALFVAVFLSTLWCAGVVRREGRMHPESSWCVQLASMAQVSLVGYLVGGAFLSLSYFDLPYNIMMLVVLSMYWTRRQSWNTEPDYNKMKWVIPGVKTVA